MNSEEFDKKMNALKKIEQWVRSGTNPDLIRSRLIECDILLRIYGLLRDSAPLNDYEKFIRNTGFINFDSARAIETQICGDVFSLIESKLNVPKESEEDRKKRLEQERQMNEVRNAIEEMIATPAVEKKEPEATKSEPKETAHSGIKMI